MYKYWEEREGNVIVCRIHVERLMHSFSELMVVCGMRSNMDHLGYGNIPSALHKMKEATTTESDLCHRSLVCLLSRSKD